MRVADLFAGMGGFSVGAQHAGAEVVFAANHWPLAVRAHQLNHPEAKHVCQDLRQYDFYDMPEYDVLLAAPACQGHSQASQPKRRRYHDDLRSTAWAVIDCVDATRPDAVLVENVPDFLRWELYPPWKQSLEIMGYEVQEHLLTATDFGVPQKRTRLFLIASRQPVNFAYKQGVFAGQTPFRPCIEDRDGLRWKAVSDATVRVKERIAKGRKNHGARFLTQHVTGHPGVSLDEPIRTITTKAQWCLVDGDRYRMLTPRELARGMGFPDEYRWPEGASKADKIRGIGNAVCPPVAKALVQAVM